MLHRQYFTRSLRGGCIRATTLPTQPQATQVGQHMRDTPTHVHADNDSQPDDNGHKMKQVFRYVVSQADYNEKCVGEKALALLALQNKLQAFGIEVEKSVSLPFGSVKQLLEGHYENAAQSWHVSKVQQSIDELLDDHGLGSEGAALQSEKVNRRLFEARHVLQFTSLPELAKTELVDAFLEAGMPMPTNRAGWELLEMQIADAISQIFTPLAFNGETSTLLKEPISVLLRDRITRDYEFTAFVTASGGVYGEFRVPFCIDRGMWFSWDGSSGSQPRTVCHPCPTCMTSSHTTLVELDGELGPASVHAHHVAGRLTFQPARDMFEGDNLLVVPRYRQVLFQKLANVAQRTWEAWAGVTPCNAIGGVTAPLRLSGFVTQDMRIILSDVIEDDCGLLGKPWSSECTA